MPPATVRSPWWRSPLVPLRPSRPTLLAQSCSNYQRPDADAGLLQITRLADHDGVDLQAEANHHNQGPPEVGGLNGQAVLTSDCLKQLFNRLDIGGLLIRGEHEPRHAQERLEYSFGQADRVDTMVTVAMKLAVQDEHVGQAVDEGFRLGRIEGVPIETLQFDRLAQHPDQAVLDGEDLTGRLVGDEIQHRQYGQRAGRDRPHRALVDRAGECPFAEQVVALGAVGVSADRARELGQVALGLGCPECRRLGA